MNENDAVRSAKGVVQREWWVVAIALVAALVVGGLMGRAQATSYQATSTLLIDYPALSRYKGVPSADELIRQSSGSNIRERVATASGVAVAKIASGLKVSSTGSPQNRLVITYTASDKDEALKVASAASAGMVDYVRERAELEISTRRALGSNADEALAGIDKALAGAKLTPAERIELQYRRWEIRKDAIEAATAVKVIETLYSPEGDTTVAERAVSSGRNGTLLAAGLVGLVAGLVIAAVREYMLRRDHGA